MSASWLLRLEDLLLIPFPLDNRLFKNDIRDTRLGSVEDAEDDTGSCADGMGAGTNESSKSVRDLSDVAVRRVGVSDDLSASG